MKTRLQRWPAVLLAVVWLAGAGFASAYNGRPRLVVVIIVDQFRGDYLLRYQDQFGPGGFRLFLDRGAVFTDCNYDYVTSSVHWDPEIADHDLPSSLYLTHKPAFFGDMTWPWVDPTGAQQLHTLPAKARYDAGTPFAPP